MGVPRESRRNTDTQAHANLQLRDVDGILVRSRALHPDMQRCFLAAFVHVVDTDSASDSNVARRGKAAQATFSQTCNEGVMLSHVWRDGLVD